MPRRSFSFRLTLVAFFVSGTLVLSSTATSPGHPWLEVTSWLAGLVVVLTELFRYLRGRLDDDRTVEDEVRRLVNVTTDHLTLATCTPELDDGQRLDLRWRFAERNRPPGGPDSYPITELGEAWRRAGEGRHHLVVLGSSGAGKTTAALVLLTVLVTSLDGVSDFGVGTPRRLPVLLSLAHWRPPPNADAAQVFLSLSGWLDRAQSREQRLAGLTRQVPQVSALLRRRRILLLLDGLDEMPADVRGQVLVALATVGDQVPYVLLARPEHLGVLHEVDLDELTVAELLPLEPEAVCRRLTRKWPAEDREELLRRVRKGDAPLGGLIDVLRSPFTAFLALKVYGDSCSPADRKDLLAGTRSAVKLERDLLSRYISDVTDLRPRKVRRSLLALQHRSAVIGSRWDPEKQKRWLEFLATLMTERRLSGVAWWLLVHPAADTEFRAERVRLRLPDRSVAKALMLLAGLGASVASLLLSHALGVIDALLRNLPAPFTVWIAAPSVTGYLEALRTAAADPALTLVLPGALAGLFLAGVVGWAPQPTVAHHSAVDRVAANHWSAVRSAAVAALAATGVVSVCVLAVAALGDRPTVPELRVVGAMAGVEFVVGFAALLWTSQWGRFCRVRTRLSLRRQAPWRMLQFLRYHADAGALRRVGEMYEFRAPSLLDHLTVAAVETVLGDTLPNLVREKREQHGAPTTAPDVDACAYPQLARELALRLESDGETDLADAVWRLLVARSPDALDEHVAVMEWRRRRACLGLAGRVARWLARDPGPVTRGAPSVRDADLGNAGMERMRPPVPLDAWPSIVAAALHAAAMAGATRCHVHSGQLLLALAREATQDGMESDGWRALLRRGTVRLDVELALVEDVPAWGGGSINGIATTSAVRAAFHHVFDALSPDQLPTAEQLALALVGVPGSGAARAAHHAGLGCDELAALLCPPRKAVRAVAAQQ
jgi:hypothetical protein